MNIVEQSLLADSQLDRDILSKTLATIFQHNIDYADLYFQACRNESWMLEDGIVKEGSYNIERGVGVRAISGEKTGFAYSDDITEHALLSAANAARGIVSVGKSASVQALKGL